MRNAIRTALMVLVALAAAAPSWAAPPAVSFVGAERYEQPAPDLPVPAAEPPADVKELIGYPEFLVAREAYLKALEAREPFVKAIDEAYERAVVAHADWWTEISGEADFSAGGAWRQAKAFKYRLEFMFALVQMHEHDESVRAAARTMYAKFEMVFRLAGDAEQERLIAAFDARLDELITGRRHVVALMEHHRRRFDARMERAKKTGARRPPTSAELGDAARASLGHPNVRRAYVWLVPETALHLEVHDRLLELREEVIDNTVVHPARLDAYRALPDPGPHVARPVGATEKAGRLEQMRLRFRRIKLQLIRREIQAETIFTRATSMAATTGKSIREFYEKSAVVLQGMQRNGRVVEESITGGYGEQIIVTFAAEAALARRLAGDLLGTLAVDPLLDKVKNKLANPMLKRIGYELKDSIDRAFEAYSKESATVRAQIALVDAIVRDETWEGGRAVVAWAMARTAPKPPGASSVAGRSGAFQELRADPQLVEAGGGPLGAYEPIAISGGEVAALHVATARDLLRANVRAGLVRVGVARGLAADVRDGAEPTTSLLRRVVHPLSITETLTRKIDDRAGFFANWAAMVYEIPKTIASDWVLGAADRFKTFAEYRVGGAADQDGFLKAHVRFQGRFDELVSALVRVEFDYDRLRADRGEWMQHMAARAVSHEYIQAYRRIRRAHFERELLWLQARHEVESTRSNAAPKLDVTGEWAMADTKARDELEQAHLAARAAWRRLRYLAYTGDFAGAAAQVEALEKLHEHWLAINQRPADIDFSGVAEAFRVEAVRGDVIAIYQELWRIAVTETVISFVSAKIASHWLARKTSSGKFQYHPPTGGPSAWTVARQRVWQTLNPWAGKFTVGGVYGTLKGVTVDTVRDVMVTIAADQQKLIERADLDAMLDFAFNVLDTTQDDIAEHRKHLKRDKQADEALYRERAAMADTLRGELAAAEKAGDAETARRARAALMAVTGDLRAQDSESARILDEAKRQAARIADSILARQLDDEVTARLPDDGGQPVLLDEAARRAEALHAHARLHDEAVTARDLDPLVHPDDPTGLQGRLFRGELDVHSFRAALARAAMNDPGKRTELLAQSMALDLVRARRTDALVEQFLRDTPWGERVDVLREGNYIAVIGGDPTDPGRRDVPGLHVDLELDFVLKGGDASDADIAKLRDAFHEYMERRGYAKPDAEGTRSSLGARFHFQTEADLGAKGRKSEVHVPRANKFEGERLKDPSKRPEELTEDEVKRLAIDDDLAVKLEKQRGFERTHAKKMSLLAQLFNGILIVRNGNPPSVPYMNDPEYLAKDMSCKAKTARVGGHIGLVVNPRHEVQAEAWNDAIDTAKAAVETARTTGGDVAAAQKKLAGLERDRGRAEAAWDEYGEVMQKKYGYRVTSEGLVTKDGYKGIHGDYDLHGLFFLDADGRAIRASLGNGQAADNQAHAPRVQQLNEFLSAAKKMFLHGAQDDWLHPGKTSDPPVTIFLSDAIARELGVSSPVFLDSPEAMRAFYQNKLGIQWEYADGAGDLTWRERWSAFWAKQPVPPGYKGGRFRSVGGARWKENRRGSSTPWVPIPIWQTYGIALDLMPRLAFLSDPKLTAEAIADAPNAIQRRRRLEAAFGEVDAFLALCDVWVIATPEGNLHYNGATDRAEGDRLGRREWRAQFAARDGRLASSETAAALFPADLERAKRAAAARAGARPDGWARQVFLDVQQIVGGGGTGLTADDLAKLDRVVAAHQSGRSLDALAALGDGKTTASMVKEATELLAWMRRVTPTLLADIGFETARELRLLYLGTDREYEYAEQEAQRVAALLRVLSAEAPLETIAFARPPLAPGDARMVPLDRAYLRGAIASDFARADADRRRARRARSTSPMAPPDRKRTADRSARRVERWIETWERAGGVTK